MNEFHSLRVLARDKRDQLVAEANADDVDAAVHRSNRVQRRLPRLHVGDVEGHWPAAIPGERLGGFGAPCPCVDHMAVARESLCRASADAGCGAGYGSARLASQARTRSRSSALMAPAQSRTR